MISSNLKYWLSIEKISGLGPATAKKIYEHFKDIKAVWRAGLSDLLQVNGLHESVARKIINFRGQIDPEKELEKLNRFKNIKIITFEDPEYPVRLKNIYDPPLVLYLKGNCFDFNKPAFAIVGTRKASVYGLDKAFGFAKELSQQGFIIVSGLAEGIDSAAHKGALDAKGITFAVLGHSLDQEIYPPQNLELAEKIEKQGLLISDFSFGTIPGKYTFPRRNRIISGLSDGVLVVEGAKDSGSLITADFALEQGREVFALPGQIDHCNSVGPHALIKQGAKLVENINDILEELNCCKIKKTTSGPIKPGNLSVEEELIFNVLQTGPFSIEELSMTSKLVPTHILSVLTQMEVKGLAVSSSGRYSLRN